MSAVISSNGMYRYRLDREFPDSLLEAGGLPLVFCMLNPSVADATKVDPTIRRCLGFAQREHASGIIVVNVYAYRATEPKNLWKAADPVGPENDHYIREASRKSDRVICAWGVNAEPSDVSATLDAIISTGAVPYCLGKTREGHPRHPLYVRADQPLEPF